MRIAPRTMLCGIAWRLHMNVADDRIDGAGLCADAEDKASLAIGMAGLVIDRVPRAGSEASRLAW
jgi:hypothetical protein